MQILCSAALLVAALLIPASASAFDGDKWGHDPQTRAWFKSLRSPLGVSCCDYADGTRLEDPEWRENPDGTYSVFARGEWRIIDQDHIVAGSNRVGYAILWWPVNWPHPSCFLPGARG